MLRIPIWNPPCREGDIFRQMTNKKFYSLPNIKLWVHVCKKYGDGNYRKGVDILEKNDLITDYGNILTAEQKIKLIRRLKYWRV
jgi:hypothetical protein